MSLIETGIRQGYFSLSDDAKRITYNSQGKRYKFTDPEEHVRAQYYVELVDKYGYQPNCIDMEVPVPRRTPNDFADIVVYENPSRKQPYIVVECKRHETSDEGYFQAIEQAFGNTNSLRANYAAVIAGNTRRFFDVASHAASERTRNIIADIPVKYGLVEKFRYKKGDTDWDLSPVGKDVLVQILGKCHDTLWDGGRMDPTEAFDELCKFIFVKMQDELRPRKKGKPYDFQIKTEETPHSVYRRVRSLYDHAKEVDPEVFSDELASNPEKTLSIVNHLQGVSLSKTDLDTKGVAFENFMEDFFRGKQGQYFTPREIVRFILAICGVNRDSMVLDPACGSGGFLLYTLDHVRTEASSYADPGTEEHYKYWHDFAANRLHGIEVNERISRVAKMNMVLHDDGHTNVICHDALDDLNELKNANQELRKNHFDLILTNPPFGAEIKFEEKPYPNTYELGRTSQGVARKKQKSEILFIERCWQFLKPGTGRLAIILPDGILTNHTQKYVRQFIVERFEIKAIVSLPQVTFEHYGAGVKSSVLILRKRWNSEQHDDQKIFAAVPKNVGYDATGRSSQNDLPSVEKKFLEFSQGKLFSGDSVFTKPASSFNRNRLDPYYYSPIFDRINNQLSSGQYQLMSLEQICVDGGIFSGKTPAKEDYSEKSYDPQIIKVSSLKRSKVDLELVRHVKPDVEMKKFVRDGDILMLASAHQADYLGRNPCIVSLPASESSRVSFVAELMCIRVNESIVNPYFLVQILSTDMYYLLVNRERRGQTSHIYPRDIKKIKVPVPEMKMQNQQARKYKSAYTTHESYIQKAETLMAEAITEFATEFTGNPQQEQNVK